MTEIVSEGESGFRCKRCGGPVMGVWTLNFTEYTQSMNLQCMECRTAYVVSEENESE